MGKAGLVGQKIMATLASTGTRSHCLHPAEAVHGDLGRVHRDDVMLILSQSGETEEIVRLLAVAGRVGRADRGDHGPGRQHAGPGGHGGDRTGPAGRGLLAGAGPQHEHHGHAGRRRRPGPGHQPDAATSAARISPASIPAGSLGRQAEQGRRTHAAAGAVPRGPRRADGARGAGRRAACRAGGPGRRCWSTSRASCRASSPTATWPGCSSSAATSELDGPIRDVMTARPLTVCHRLDDGRRRGDHGRAEDQRIAGGRCRRAGRSA